MFTSATLMDVLSISVPKGRCADDWWSRCPPATVAAVLEAVGSLISVDGDSRVQIELLKERLQGANEAAQCAAREASARIEEVWTRRSEEKDQVIFALREQCAGFKTMADQAQAACETQQRLADSLAQTLERGSHASTTTSAQELGGIAENDVENIVADTLACEIADVSHIAGHGDRFITTPNGLKLLLEVKNVERLHSKHDIEKFRNDVYNGIQSQRINAALLVSLKTSSIPNVSGSCSVTFLQSDAGRIPVMLLSSRSKATIQLALHAIEQLQSLASKEAKARGGGTIPSQLEALERERQILQRSLPIVLKFVSESDTAVESRIEMLQRLLDDATAERTRQKEVNYQLLKLKQGVSWIGASQETSDIDKAVNLILDWHERRGEFPKTSEMTLPQRAAIKTAGGLKHVTDMARKRQRETEAPAEN